MSQINNTPKEWTSKKLGDICDIVMGQSPPSSTYNSRKIGLPFFQGKAEFTELHPMVKKWCTEPNKIAEPNDILLSVRAPVGTTNIANQRCCIGRGLAAIRFPCHLFLFYYLRHIKNELEEQGTGTTFKAISGEILKNTRLILPPLFEQQKIVEIIEELFSELDKGVESLKKAKEQLKIYRQSVLKNAFEGKLTEKWREQNKYKLEPPEILLEKIKKEREEAAKKQGKKIKPVKSLTEQELAELPELPLRWIWSRFDYFGIWQGGGTPSKSNLSFWNTGEIMWISPKDMKSMYITNTEDKITSIAVQNSSTNLIAKDAILFVVRSGILRRILPVAITTAKCTVNQDLQSFTPFIIPSKYLYWFCMAYNENIRKECSKDGTTVESINTSLLKEYRVPLCSIQEQHQIVQEIESRLSVCDEMEKTVEESLKKAEKLRQSILKKAFEGKLTEKWRQENPELISGENSAESLLKKINSVKGI